MHQDFSFTAQDGLILYGWYSAPEGVVSKTIALVHGMGEHSNRYHHVAKVFNNAGYAFISFDLRGHGKSQGPRGHAPAYRYLMDDIKRFLAEAETYFPGTQKVLYGHSMGGNLVLNYSINETHDLNAVIATAPYLQLAFAPPKWKIILAKIGAALFPALSQPSGLKVTDISRSPEVVEAYKADPLVHDKITASFFVNIEKMGSEAMHKGSLVKVPTLVMHGTEDHITREASSRLFASQNPAKIRYYPATGLYHEIHNEPEQAQVFEVMLQWLDGLKD